MTAPFYGEMQVIGFNFAPADWALCDGQTIAISDNTALFSLIGNFYGGDGRTTFGIPDMRGRVPVGYGTYISAIYGTTIPYNIGLMGGATDITLGEFSLPSHTHSVQATADLANRAANNQGGTQLAVGSIDRTNPGDAYAGASNLRQLSSAMVSSFGGGASHTNVQPTLTLMFVMSLDGIYPSRN